MTCEAKVDNFGSDLRRPVVIGDPAEHVTPKKQKLRQCEQIFEGCVLGTAKIKAIDRRREVGDGDPSARTTSGADHHEFGPFKPVNSAG